MQRAGARGKAPVLTIVHKANVLKLTDGLFRECAFESAAEFPEITVRNCWLIRLPCICPVPAILDCWYTNLFGDILSDEASGLVGGWALPLGQSWQRDAVFEPVHAPPGYRRQGIANPVGALLSSALMLETLGEPRAAGRLRQTVLDTLATGLRTADLGAQPAPRSSHRLSVPGYPEGAR